jgi:hypothetical protein
MGEPTARFYTDRQTEFKYCLTDIVEVAYRRSCLVTGSQAPEDLQLEVHAPEVARADNESLAKAARDIVTALSELKAQGWITDDIAVKMAFKFAGEPLGEDEINRILSTAAASDKEEQDE